MSIFTFSASGSAAGKPGESCFLTTDPKKLFANPHRVIASLRDLK